MMRSRFLLIVVLMSGAILLGVSSCATAPTKPLAPGELRLLGASVAGSGFVYYSTYYEVRITFEADGEPTIRRACFNWLGGGPYCYAVKPRDVEFGSPGSFKVTLPANLKTGSNLLECYTEYFRQDNKILRTNLIKFFVNVY
jgi:hypothetical protein